RASRRAAVARASRPRPRRLGVRRRPPGHGLAGSALGGTRWHRPPVHVRASAWKTHAPRLQGARGGDGADERRRRVALARRPGRRLSIRLRSSSLTRVILSRSSRGLSMRSLSVLCLAALQALPSSASVTYTARLETTKGPIVIAVHRDWAPRGADRFRELVERGYYDEAAIFRIRKGTW